MGILQARVLEWVANSYSGDLPNPGIEPMSLMSPMHRQKGSLSLAPRGKPHSNLCRKPNFQLSYFLYQRKILIGKEWNLKTCDGKIFMAVLENTELQNPLNFLSLQKPATLLGQTASVPTFSLAEDVKRLHLKQMLCGISSNWRSPSPPLLTIGSSLSKANWVSADPAKGGKSYSILGICTRTQEC